METQPARAKTVASTTVGKKVVGYMVNTLPSPENRAAIANLQSGLTAVLGGTLWTTPPDTLHITLMDWVAPLVDYGQDKDELFEAIYPEYDETLSRALAGYRPITVRFDAVKVSPEAIYIVGTDRGEFQAIRNGFLARTPLLPGTKQPPAIIHSTIARFTEAYDLGPIEALVKENQLVFDQQVTSFRLVRETVAPLLEHKLIKEYVLQ